MKKNRLLVLGAALSLLAFVASCSKPGTNPTSFPRGETTPRGPSPESRDSVIKHDVYMSVVSVPRGYDWLKDTLFGDIEAKLLLLKNMKPVLELKAGKGTDILVQAGTHHIFETHLYTEGPDKVLKDGKPYFSCTAHEHIVGLERLGKNVYCLTQCQDGSLVLRCDGDVVNRYPSGNPKRLYSDGGHIYFSYDVVIQGERKLYLVEDGLPVEVVAGKGRTALDARMYQGKRYLLYTEKFSYYISDGKDSVKHCTTLPESVYDQAELIPFGKGCGALITRVFDVDRGYSKLFLTGSRGIARLPGEKESYLLSAPLSVWAEVDWRGDGSLFIYYSQTESFTVDKDVFLPGEYCIGYRPKDLVIAYTDKAFGLPILWDNGKEKVYDCYGYATALELNPSN